MKFFTILSIVFLSLNLTSCATNQIKQAPRKSINANFPSDVAYVNHAYENGEFFYQPTDQLQLIQELLLRTAKKVGWHFYLMLELMAKLKILKS